MKRLGHIIVLAVLALLFAVAVHCYGQGYLSARQRAILNQLYLSQTGAINGALIIDGTISTSKLDFAVVPFGDWTNHLAEFSVHTLEFTNHVTDFSNHVADLFGHQSLRTVGASTTMTTNDRTVLIDAGAQAVTVTLPTAVGAQSDTYYVKSVNSSNAAIVLPNGSELIDGATNFPLYTDESIRIQSDNTNWFIL